MSSGAEDLLSALGPFFAVRLHARGAAPAAPWRPLAELVRRPEALLGRIGSVRTALADRSRDSVGEVELKVAASLAQLGLVARLTAPALAAMACGYRLEMDLDQLWWQDELGGPVPLSVPAPAARGALAACDVLDQVVAPITAATAELVAVSPRVLWGNVASAVNGAASQVAVKRPDLAADSWAVADAFFGHPGLSQELRRPGPGFRRSSCCLLYRLVYRSGRAGAGWRDRVCGDCVLTSPVSGNP